MSKKPSNPDQYLLLLGRTYYANVRVPRTLEKYVGQSSQRVSLKTGDRVIANQRKHAVVGSIKAELAALRLNPTEKAERGISLTAALQWKESLKASELANDVEQADLIRDLIHAKADDHERLYGTAKAVQWHRAATTTGDTLTELHTQWLATCDFKESTKERHRRALSAMLAFTGNAHAVPPDITRSVALSYLDSALTQRGLSHASIGSHLVSLGGFWQWLASRGAVAWGFNPWKGHRVSRARNQGRTVPKRIYTGLELLQLLTGNATVRAWPTFSYLPDLIVLGLFTGARINELCSLTITDIQQVEGHYVISITDSKTKAGIRYVAITHAAPAAIIKQRLSGPNGSASLFPELSPGGTDNKLSSSAVKAYSRYRRACNVPDGADFHSYRRNVITLLEAANVGQVAIARFVGHKVGTMAGDTYSAGGNIANAISTSNKIRYSPEIEAAALSLATR